MEAVIDTSGADDQIVADEAEALAGYVQAAIEEGDANSVEMLMALGIVMQSLMNMISAGDGTIH